MRLGIITCYFNPCGYRRLRENYHRFVRELGEHSSRLLTAELILDDDEPLDCPRVRLSQRGRRPGHELWQKERLLNAAWQSLPQEYDAVAWVDCDVLFPGPGWVELAEEMLSQRRVVQLFERAELMGPSDEPYLQRRSIVSVRQRGNAVQGAWGLAWAARRDEVSLCDSFVVGGGDVHMGKAFMGDRLKTFGNATELTRYYKHWAASLKCRKPGDVGCLPITIRHCFHGRRENRRYAHRDGILARHRFDPGRDVARDGATLRWADPESALAREVRGWFGGRREDA